MEKQTLPVSPIPPVPNVSPESIKPLEDETPAQFLQRLKQYTPEFDIFKYVSKGTQFYLDILDILMKKINFQKMAIDKALRTFLLNYNLPVEAQEIDRVIKAFADKYHVDNPSIYPTADFPYILAYSLIMLNTDLHNPKVKNKMTTKQFISNVEHSEVKYYIPKEILEIIYDNIKVNEFISQNQVVQSPSQLLKRKSGVLQRSLSILTRKNSMSLTIEKNFNNTKYENEYDIALDLEYSIMTLANLKIELSSYLCVNQPNIYDLSLLMNNLYSHNNSIDSINNQYENSPKLYHNSPLSTNVRNCDLSSTCTYDSVAEENGIVDNKIYESKISKEELQEDYNVKNDENNLPYGGKSKKSIDNSDIGQMSFKNKNNEVYEKEKFEKKSKIFHTLTLPKKSLFSEKNSFHHVNNIDITQSLNAIDSFYHNKTSHNNIDHFNTKNMILCNSIFNYNNNIPVSNSVSTPNSPVIKCEFNSGHEVIEEDSSNNSSYNNSFNLIPISYNSNISVNNEDR